MGVLLRRWSSDSGALIEIVEDWRRVKQGYRLVGAHKSPIGDLGCQLIIIGYTWWGVGVSPYHKGGTKIKLVMASEKHDQHIF